MQLADGWSMWSLLQVRGAGFPTRAVLELAAQDSASIADELLAFEERIAFDRQAAIVGLKQLIGQSQGPMRKKLDKVVRKIEAGSLPATELEDMGAGSTLEELRRAEAKRSELAERFESQFAADAEGVSDALSQVARGERFREAILWQNRRALPIGIDRVANRTPDKKYRQREHLVASYLQRYCCKNDQIGFFGPVGWGRIGSAGEAMRVQPGPSLLSRRTVYFEQWGIDVLAAQLSADPDLRPSISPRRSPAVFLEGSTLHRVGGPAIEIPVEAARILSACDGQTAARDIAAALIRDPDLDLDSDDEVYDLLEQLVSSGVATWQLEVPCQTAHPDRYLLELLQAMPSAPAGEAAIESLELLRAARDDVQAAAGDPPALDVAFENLETAFSRITAEEATRRGGQTYAGRTLVYEDCVRDLDLSIPPNLAGAGQALALMLQSARWYTHEVARVYRAAFATRFDEIERELGSGCVEYARFYERVLDLIPASARGSGSPVDAVLSDLHARWSRILEFDPAERRVQRSSTDLRAAVEREFASPGPGWPAARVHAPDLQIAARSVDQIARGEALVVIGELHIAVNSIATPGDLEQTNEPDAMITAFEEDLGLDRVEMVVPKDRAGRVLTCSPSPSHIHVELGQTRSWRPRDRVVAVSELVIERRGESLSVRTIDGRFEWDVLAFMESVLGVGVASRFSLGETARHQPRIIIDNLAISRESWRFEPTELDFARLPRGPDQFLSARRWARQSGLPRWVFVKIPEEMKPIYVDFASPIYVELLAKMVRKASQISMSEMLPAPPDVWLSDASGQTYTSELRFVAVDPEPWRPA